MDTYFFVPGAADQTEAEAAYGRMAASLASRFGALDPTRFSALYTKLDGVHRTIRVGLSEPDGEDPVVAIFRLADDGRYLLLTPTRGGTVGDPIEAPAVSLPVRFRVAETDPATVAARPAEPAVSKSSPTKTASAKPARRKKGTSRRPVERPAPKQSARKRPAARAKAGPGR